jgi:opacity protein-like surface antigen
MNNIAMKQIFIFVFLSFTCTSLLAQSNFSITYSIGLPAGDVKDFVSRGSFRGIALDYRYIITPQKALGFMVGMNTFYDEMPSETYTIENSSLTGKQYRYSNHIPMLATATYYFEPNEFIRPYATFGVGTMYSRRNTDMNLYTFEQEAWNFALQPEIGLQFELTEDMGLVLTGKYFHGFEAGSELTGDQSYFSLNVGFCFF